MSPILKPAIRVAICTAAVLAIAAGVSAVHLSDRLLSVALNLFLIVVLIASAVWGAGYAIFLSLLSTLAFSLSIPPAGHFHFADGRVWAVLAACLVVGLTASYLSDRLRGAVLDANQRRAEAVTEQQRFEDLVNSVEGIVWEADANTFVFSFVSEQAERILGYPTERWLREPTFWKDHLHPADRDWAVQFCVEATAQKRRHDFEYRMIAADGRVVWMRDLVTVVVEKGHPNRLRGVMVDVTDRKLSEKAMQEQASLLDLTHDAIHVRDMQRVIRYWNRGAEALYAWTAEEAAGANVYDLLKTVFPAPIEQIEAEVVRTGRWEGELVHTRKDGRKVVVASRWSLQRDETGAPVAVIVSNNDITERKRAEQARQDLEEQWRAAFESNPTMYFIVDQAGTIVTVNSFGAEQLGYTVEELLGKPVLSVFHDADRDRVQKLTEECFEYAGRMSRWEARKIRKDGTMLWVRETANAVFLKKRPVLLIVCENITEQRRAQEAARRSDRELRDVIETIPANVWSTSVEGGVDFVNQRWEQYTGLAAEDGLGWKWEALVHPDDRARFVGDWREALKNGQPLESEARVRRADGKYRWWFIRNVPLRDEAGKIVKWYGTAIDVEDRKRAEALLGGEKRILEMVAKADSLPEILATLCRLVEEQTSGVLASILLLEGNRLWHGGAPSLPKAYSDAINGAMIGPSAGSCGTAAYRGKQVIVEDIATDPLWADYCQLALPHGLRACWSTPVFSSQGKVIATFAMYYREPRSPSQADQEIIEQITHLAGVAIERKLTYDQLQRSEAYLSEAQRLTHTGSWAYAPGGAFYWSEESYRIWGFDPQQPVPDLQIILERVHPEDRGRAREHAPTAQRERRDYEQEFRIVLPHGIARHIHTVGHPVFSASGELVEVVGTYIDVTDRKRAEEEREKLRQIESDLAHINRVTMMGELAASLGHEIKQPLAAAITNANTCLRWLKRDEPDLQEVRDAASRMVEDVMRSVEIINRTSSLYKKGAPQRELVDVNAVIREIVALLHQEAARSGVSIRSELAADLPTVTGDRVQLQQVLMNLLINGIDAMRGIDGTREITVASRYDGDDQLLVSVTDTGIGLPPQVDRIFNPFFTTKPHGTGMGLAISRTIIESHGGRMSAVSNTGPGATFRFTLPASTGVQA